MRVARSQAGFSLLEIVIAVSIMAIIAALVVPQVFNYLKRSKKSATKVALSTVQNNIETYHSDVGAYPTTLGDLITRPVDQKAASRWEGPYVKNEPKDGFGNELVYVLNPKGTQPPYELYSWGPNGEGSPQEEWIRARDV